MSERDSGAAFDARATIIKKRDGHELPDADIEGFIREYAADRIPDYQASALLMAIFIRGMNPRELGTLTRAMLHSGEVFDFRDLDGPKVDKHSTGGVGDKVSIPLAPAVAACGAYVPMISGRGLGHTGGTLDKLESIPGFNTKLDAQAFRKVLTDVGFAMGGQTPTLVPADRKLYALRDVTGLVEAIPLIASSIMSKKLAEGIDALVLDVKFGTGAFMVEVERGKQLADTMVAIANECGVKATAFQTNMNRPLGLALGNALEIIESLECLEGVGPADLRELVVLQGGEMLRLVGLANSLDEGQARIARSLDDGTARERFMQMVRAQGGDTKKLEAHLDLAPGRVILEAEGAGHLVFEDLRAIGHAIGLLGGGRLQLGDEIDPGVGLRLLVGPNEFVHPGQPILEILHRDARGLDQARQLITNTLRFDPLAANAPLVLDTF